MPTLIFVNLPVKDLSRSVEFFTKLGFTFNPQFTDETATCMIVSETIYVMLLTEAKFQTFTPKAICDAKQSTEVLVSLALESRQAVEDLVRKAFDAGGSNYAEPQDYGFMYQHGFEDLDGHIWELFYMDPSAVNQGSTMAQQQGNQASDLPAGLGKPAQRALAGVGYSQLEQLTAVSEGEIKQLHGIGPNAIEQLRQALAAKGLSFANKE